MWLLVAAPTVSRVLPAWGVASADASHAMHGDAMSGMPGMEGMAMHDMASMPHAPQTPGDPVHSMDQCGYCVLLGHSPLLSGGVVALLLAAPLPAPAPAATFAASWHAQPLLSAHPRGPPSARLG